MSWKDCVTDPTDLSELSGAGLASVTLSWTKEMGLTELAPGVMMFSGVKTEKLIHFGRAKPTEIYGCSLVNTLWLNLMNIKLMSDLHFEFGGMEPGKVMTHLRSWWHCSLRTSRLFRYGTPSQGKYYSELVKEVWSQTIITRSLWSWEPRISHHQIIIRLPWSGETTIDVKDREHHTVGQWVWTLWGCPICWDHTLDWL